MAKGKHSVALFEVIQSGKSTSRGSATRTPKWWFNGRTSGTANSTAAPQAAAPVAAVDGSTAPAPRIPGVDLKVDPDRQRIKFDVSYSSALVAAFTVIVVVSLAYIIGKHMTRGPAQASASTEQLIAGPARPDVLDVHTPIVTKVESSAPSTPKRETAQAAVAPAASGTAVQEPAPTATPPAQPQRTINLNYVVVQSYPEEKNANDARDLLNKNGIPCSVEKSLPGWGGQNWYSVVGLTGFDHIKDNPAYEQYKKSIIDLSTKYAGTSKFRKFEPAPLKWK